MVRTYSYNPSTQTSDYLPGSSKYLQSDSFPVPNQQNFRSISPPSQRQKFTKEDECPFSTHYKQIANQVIDDRRMAIDDRRMAIDDSRMAIDDSRMMPEKNNSSKIFGIESVVIDGQCFYRLLDQQLNKALNEQFVSLKLIPSQTNHPSPSKRIEKEATKPQVAYPEQQHPTDPIMQSNPFMEPPHNFHQLEDDLNLKLRLGTSSTNQNEKMIEDLPWARGNPQPKNGKRGTLEWSFGQRSNPFNEPTYKPYSGWLNDSFVSKRPDNLYQTTSKDAYSSYLDPPKPINYPVNLGSTYDSFHSEPLNNYINPFTYGTTPEERKRYEKEQHRIDLLRQIEDNNRRKMLEKQRDWQEDQRERWRSEMTLRRQREEVQKEQDEVRARQFAAELKAQRAEFEPQRRKNSMNRGRETPKPERRRKSPTENEVGPRLEWWEKKPTWQDRQISSPAIPALRSNNQQNQIPSRQSRADSLAGISASRLARRSASIENQETNVDRSMSLQSRQSRSQSRHSRHSYQPSLVSRSGSNGTALRNLSATRQQLEHEFQKVQAAVKKNQYDSRVFD